jgi:hypothetical protein
MKVGLEVLDLQHGVGVVWSMFVHAHRFFEGTEERPLMGRASFIEDPKSTKEVV